ncbi:hypothetical protein LTR66_015407, partial [Elasticomyces elasticus]
ILRRTAPILTMNDGGAIHHTDKYGNKFVDKIGELQSKTDKHTKDDDKPPAGGFDDTELPNTPPGYTIRITFHRAENLPFADLPQFSSDPYIHATIKTALPERHKQDPDLTLRIPTLHKTVDPNWGTQWVVAHMPASGFFLKCRIYDEDATDHDDRLGNVHVNVDRIDDNWKGFHEETFKLKKRMGSKRAYLVRGLAALMSRKIKMSGHLIVSVENLGRSPGDSGSRAYTVAPLPWSRHNSPLIGRLAGTKNMQSGKDGKSKSEKYNFQAIQMQLRGPTPVQLYHRYVEFKPFVAGMFTDHSLRGRILNRALHHQHARVYNYDTSTVYGVFEKPCIEMTKQFLEFVHFDQGGRIFTYVLSLDGLWRFTETGKEFGIDMLSKHTMHSDVSIYIAFSGEFFIRRIRHHESTDGRSTDKADFDPLNDTYPPGDTEDNEKAYKDHPEHEHNNIPRDPSHYELIIDNDSGTYRPNAKMLPLLKQYMSESFPGLRIATLNCGADEEKMNKLKTEQRERKKEKGQMTYLQNSSQSSFSSSDEEDLEQRALGMNQGQFTKKANKMRHPRHPKKGLEGRHGPEETQQAGIDHALTRPDDHAEHKDARDFGSSSSGTAADGSSNASFEAQRSRINGKPSSNQDGYKEQEGYQNNELPGLLKNKEELRHEDYGTQLYGEVDTGEDKPAGGIAYHRVVAAGV